MKKPRKRVDRWRAFPWNKTLCYIRLRCNSKPAINYSRYGAVGIKCLITSEELKFLWNRDNAGDMKKPSIDRINSKGNYTLKNCRYIEHSENVILGSRNKNGLCRNKLHKYVKENILLRNGKYFRCKLCKYARNRAYELKRRQSK